jgi:hypothetical protein
MTPGLRLLRLAFASVTALSLSCMTPSTPRYVQPGHLRVLSAPLGLETDPKAPHTVVLIALDGVRWNDVFHGVEKARAQALGFRAGEVLSARQLVPNLSSLADSGMAIGTNGSGITANGPGFVSLPGYLEMLTGAPTRCLDNDCAPVDRSTIADEMAAEPGTGPLDVAVIASWDRIERAASKSPENLIVSAGRHHGATRNRLRYDPIADDLFERGSKDGPEPGSGDFRRDRSTAAIALHYLRTQRPRFLFIGLGETDELAHKGDYRGYLEALGQADEMIGNVASLLSAYEREGRRTTLIVTTDHGRGPDFARHGSHAPESGAVWVVAAGAGIPKTGRTTFPRPHRLSDVAGMIRAFDSTRVPVEVSDLVVPADESRGLTAGIN